MHSSVNGFVQFAWDSDHVWRFLIVIRFQRLRSGSTTPDLFAAIWYRLGFWLSRSESANLPPIESVGEVHPSIPLIIRLRQYDSCSIGFWNREASLMVLRDRLGFCSRSQSWFWIGIVVTTIFLNPVESHVGGCGSSAESLLEWFLSSQLWGLFKHDQIYTERDWLSVSGLWSPILIVWEFCSYSRCFIVGRIFDIRNCVLVSIGSTVRSFQLL